MDNDQLHCIEVKGFHLASLQSLPTLWGLNQFLLLEDGLQQRQKVILGNRTVQINDSKPYYETPSIREGHQKEKRLWCHQI